jgi:hypothetical protein
MLVADNEVAENVADSLIGLIAGELDALMRHHEQLVNLGTVAELLHLLDTVNNDAVGLLDVQAHLFRASYRAQQAAGDIRRARKRLQDGKSPGWPVKHDGEIEAFTEPAWRLNCDSSTRADQEWAAELMVAERVVRQLKSVGDALAWALSSNSPPGPFVGKKGLSYELGSVLDHWRDRKTFTLLHDLTSVLRIVDSTEVQPNGSLVVREVKSSPRASATRQLKLAQAALDAIDGRGPLPAADPEVRTYLWQSGCQMKTHVRALSGLIERTSTSRYWVGHVGGRVAGVVNLLALAQRRADPATGWEEYAGFRTAALARHLTGAVHHLRAISADAAARDPGIAPYGIYPLPARVRAGLICDFVIIESIMAEQHLIAALERQGLEVKLLLPASGGLRGQGEHVLAVVRGERQLTLHSAAVTQLLLEWIETSRYAEAVSDLIESPDPARHGVLTFSNERAAWK